MTELQRELESVAPAAPSIDSLRTMASAQRRKRRQLLTTTLVAVTALAAFGISNAVRLPTPTANSTESADVTNLEPASESQTTTSINGECPDKNHLGLGAPEFIGLAEEAAVEQADEMGLSAILECRDGAYLISGPRPASYDTSRVWLSMADGHVTSAYRS